MADSVIYYEVRLTLFCHLLVFLDYFYLKNIFGNRTVAKAYHNGKLKFKVKYLDIYPNGSN